MNKASHSNFIHTGVLSSATIAFISLSVLSAGILHMNWDITERLTFSSWSLGALTINGLLGTLIGLEYAFAAERKWGIIAPACLALATVLLVSGFTLAGQYMLLMGSIILCSILIYICQLQTELSHLVLFLGATSLLMGNIMFSYDYPVSELVVWWMSFPLLTIFGERMKLSRMVNDSDENQVLFLRLVVVWLIGAALTHFDRTAGWVVISFALLTQAIWLLHNDMARWTVNSERWSRYSAVCLFSGCAWLFMTGIAGLCFGFPSGGPIYDALLSMILIGFVFSMVFARASAVAPSLLKRPVPFHPYFYIPLFLLHSFLLVKIIGNISCTPNLSNIGSIGIILAITLFLGGVIVRLSGTFREQATGRFRKHQ